MSESYHTANSLFDMKMQSETNDVSPVWEPKRSPGEQGAAATLLDLQNKTLNEWICFFFISEIIWAASLKPVAYINL